MWNNYLALMMMAVLLRLDYEANKPKPASNPGVTLLSVTRSPILRRERAWSEKAVKRYAESQEKKWRNWREAMFEETSTKTKKGLIDADTGGEDSFPGR